MNKYRGTHFFFFFLVGESIVAHILMHVFVHIIEKITKIMTLSNELSSHKSSDNEKLTVESYIRKLKFATWET